MKSNRSKVVLAYAKDPGLWIYFMWLSGMSYPAHNTINRFRSERLIGVLKEVFSKVVLLLADNGVVTLKEAYLNGTKIEATLRGKFSVGDLVLLKIKP